MSPIPYLFFAGNCEEALQFYAKLIGDGSEPEMMRVAGSQMEGDVAPDRQNWILHATLKTKDGVIMASDSVFDNPPEMNGASLMLSYPTVAEARAVFDQLVDDGEEEMPFEPTFWAAGFGACRDRFGVKWMVGTDEAP